METSVVNRMQVNRLYQFLNELDVRRKDDWKKRFPEISVMMKEIIGIPNV
jgi:hypothetical protein